MRAVGLFVGILAPISVCGWPDINVESSFAVVDVDSSICAVPAELAAGMREAGFVKIACPFGVLIGATSGYRDEYVLYAANVLANLLDQDADGVPDDVAVVSQLTYIVATAVAELC
jgi:hypothetical protein